MESEEAIIFAAYFPLLMQSGNLRVFAVEVENTLKHKAFDIDHQMKIVYCSLYG